MFSKDAGGEARGQLKCPNIDGETGQRSKAQPWALRGVYRDLQSMYHEHCDGSRGV